MDITALRTPEYIIKAAQQPRSFFGVLPPAAPAQPNHTFHWDILSDIFEACLTHGWDDILMTLSLRIATQAPSIPATEFPYLWLPFLKFLLKALSDSPSPRYKQLVLALLESYLTRWVGPAPSQPSQPDLSLPEVHCLRYSWTLCRDCSSLNAFLTSRVERVARFQVGKDRRRHMHQVLDQLTRGRVVPYGVTHTTDRSTRPETLVVTKTGAVRGMQMRKEWEGRVVKAKGVIQGLDEGGRLRRLLGEGEYQAILRMNVLGGVGGGVIAAGSANGAGTKRRAEDAGIDGWGRSSGL
jgi:hypothetical protein